MTSFCSQVAHFLVPFLEDHGIVDFILDSSGHRVRSATIVISLPIATR